MTVETVPPRTDEFELTLFGPGYGESIVLHVGDGVWVIVDSCVDKHGTPRALHYLKTLGLDPAQVVALIVATHWHDDHIRGMAQLVDTCSQAAFCCAAALCKMEFLSVVAALEHHSLTAAGSGAREIHDVFTRLEQAESIPMHALANRCIFARGGCEIWSLSPCDAAFQRFLRVIGDVVPREGQATIRVPDLFPNDAAVALWIKVGKVAMLLGSDLERRGWVEILRSTERPSDRASIFKVAHHGAENADLPEVWEQLLDMDPVAVLTPWRRGGNALPRREDVTRILSNTTTAYASARSRPLVASSKQRNHMVDKTVRESGIKLRRLAMPTSAVRVRGAIGATKPWQIELLGEACHLRDINR